MEDWAWAEIFRLCQADPMLMALVIALAVVVVIAVILWLLRPFFSDLLRY